MKVDRSTVITNEILSSHGAVNCVGCEFSQSGYCTKKHKWGYTLKICPLIEVEKKLSSKAKSKPTKYTKVSGLLNIFKQDKKYVARRRFDKKQHYLGSFETIIEAVTALAQFEVDNIGHRTSNKHMFVKLEDKIL